MHPGNNLRMGRINITLLIYNPPLPESAYFPADNLSRAQSGTHYGRQTRGKNVN